MILLAAALVLLFLAAWIVVPAPTMTLLALGVGVPEISPLLLLVSLAVAGAALANPTGMAHRLAILLALLAAFLCALPSAQALGALRRFNDAFAAAGIDASAGNQAGRWEAFRRSLPGGASPEVSVTREVRYTVLGAEPLMLDVYQLPRDTRGPRPILLQIYGGAWQRGAPADDALFASYFASRGYVVVAIDYRHAPRWQWPSQLQDVRAALSWLPDHAAEYQADATRIALLGRSSGGQLALMAAYTGASSGVRAVVSYYGPTNLLEGWRHPPSPDPLPVRPTLEAYLGGTPDAAGNRYREASPVERVSSSAPPALLIYGRRDHIVEARFGRELEQRLHTVGAKAVYLELPWAEHAFDAVPFGLSAQIALPYTERFLAWALAPVTAE